METTGSASIVHVTAKKNGKESSVTVPKRSVDWGAVGAGTGVGVGACCALTMIGGMGSLFFLPCALLGMVGWGAAIAGPVAGYMVWGNKMPDQVSVPLDDGPPAVASADDGTRTRY